MDKRDFLCFNAACCFTRLHVHRWGKTKYRALLGGRGLLYIKRQAAPDPYQLPAQKQALPDERVHLYSVTASADVLH
jgi:hypothetical protein